MIFFAVWMKILYFTMRSPRKLHTAACYYRCIHLSPALRALRSRRQTAVTGYSRTHYIRRFSLCSKKWQFWCLSLHVRSMTCSCWILSPKRRAIDRVSLYYTQPCSLAPSICYFRNHHPTNVARKLYLWSSHMSCPHTRTSYVPRSTCVWRLSSSLSAQCLSPSGVETVHAQLRRLSYSTILTSFLDKA